MPPDLQFRTMNLLHKALLKVSFGKIGWGAMGMPVVELTTTGRRSGEPRTTMLTSPLQEGSSTVIVASRGGDDRHPDWLLNLKDNPDVEARIGGAPRQPMHAEIVTGPKRARLWAKLTADHENYAGYQRNTDREIPVIMLTPRSG